MAKRAAKVVPITKLRIRIPKGVPIKDAIRKLEITFEEAKPGDVEAQLVSGYCCVDATIGTPVTSIRKY